MAKKREGRHMDIDNFLLTKKEQQIYDLLCISGIGLKTWAEILPHMNISFSTLKTHVYRIFEKKGVNSRAELLWQHYQENNKQEGADDADQF